MKLFVETIFKLDDMLAHMRVTCSGLDRDLGPSHGQSWQGDLISASVA